VFINFPEPPVWEGSKWRLLDAELFATVHKVLSPGGMLHILTDDEALCKYAFLKECGISRFFRRCHAGGDGQQTMSLVCYDVPLTSIYPLQGGCRGVGEGVEALQKHAQRPVHNPSARSLQRRSGILFRSLMEVWGQEKTILPSLSPFMTTYFASESLGRYWYLSPSGRDQQPASVSTVVPHRPNFEPVKSSLQAFAGARYSQM
jgi:hypothetical protein